MIPFDTFRSNASRVMSQIETACRQAQRSVDSVRLLPVTKTHPAEVLDYVIQYGFPSVGENRVQEAVSKKQNTPHPLKWELIGHLQSNKAKLAVSTFDRIQSVDSTKLIHQLASAAQAQGKILPVLLQINAGRDPAKFGAEIEEAPALLECALREKHIHVEGLMTIAPLSEDRTVARRCFASLRKLRDRLESQFGVKLPELSMGMSGDLTEAVLEGSTLLRVGSALFGERVYP